jgi:hypothetical protein
LFAGGLKHWYSTPRPKNDDLEVVLKKITGDKCPYPLNLKSYFPDPYLLLEHDIHVRSHDQCYGDIVVTFPKGYHTTSDSIANHPSTWHPI